MMGRQSKIQNKLFYTALNLEKRITTLNSYAIQTSRYSIDHSNYIRYASCPDSGSKGKQTLQRTCKSQQMAKKKYYAVAVGRNPGIYYEWYGKDGAEVQVTGFPKALFKGFPSLKEAEQFLKNAGKKKTQTQPKPKSYRKDTKRFNVARKAPLKSGGIIIYTDGGCINNPGPGGYGIVIIKGKQREELSGGFRLTTNNRMELTACIVGLRHLKRPSKVTLFSDSKYVVDGTMKGWAKRWRSNGWMRTKSEPAINPDLWEQLLDLCEMHNVEFVWVKGHAGNPENERCDRLANQAAFKTGLPADEVYEHL